MGPSELTVSVSRLWHDRRVVVRDLPFAVLELVKVRVAGLHLVTCGAHGEFVDTGIKGPIVSFDDLALEKSALRLLLQEVNKVRLDGFVVHSGYV